MSHTLVTAGKHGNNFYNLKVSDKNNLNRHTLKPHEHIYA